MIIFSQFSGTFRVLESQNCSENIETFIFQRPLGGGTVVIGHVAQFEQPPTELRAFNQIFGGN